MNQTAMFANKHKSAQLPLKYMRRSVSSLFHKNTASKFSSGFADIDRQFKDFIETPIHKSH